jgi:RNA polymerase sigma-70 factor (ECF subfamily)
VEAYLYRSVRNRALNHLKEHRHSHREQVDLARMAQSMHRNSEQTLEQHQLAKAIDQGMKEMSDRQHEVFTLSRFHDLAYAEIAEVLDVSTKTVGTHMTRALQTLREELELHRR